MTDEKQLHPRRARIHAPSHIGERLIDVIAAFFGSFACVAVHTAWFVLWFALHLDTNLLTNAVSLEAIFLCIILLMASNRQSAKDAKRDDLEADEVASLFSNHQELLELNRQQLAILQEQEGLKRQNEQILNLLQAKRKI